MGKLYVSVIRFDDKPNQLFKRNLIYKTSGAFVDVLSLSKIKNKKNEKIDFSCDNFKYDQFGELREY
jgi:hypothetical protein